MAHKQHSRVGETSATTGTGDMTFAGAIAGFQPFGDVLADGDTIDVVISMGSDWEICRATYHLATDSFTRTYRYDSSTGAAINWGAGSKIVKATHIGWSDQDATGKALNTNLLAEASATSKGVVEIANEAEVRAGTDATRPVVPSTLKTKANCAGELWGLTLSNNGTDATNDIDIAAGFAADSTNVARLILASALTKRLDAAWVVGTNQGGLDTGSIADTTYHVWLIMRSDTGVVDALFSTSATAPTMPSNYDYKRRIGSIVRSGATILAFTQLDDVFLWKTPVSDVAVANLTSTAVLYTLTVPAGIKVEALLSTYTSQAGANVAVYLSSPDQTDVAASGTQFTINSPVAAVATMSGGHAVRTNTSRQVRARSQSASNTNLGIVTQGWCDTRGRLAA